MFLGRKRRLDVDAGALESSDKESLSKFLQSSLNVKVAVSGGKVSVDSEQLSAEELKRQVNKFVYHRNLNREFWVALDGNTVKISRFKKGKKPEKRRKEGAPPATITHGW